MSKHLRTMLSERAMKAWVAGAIAGLTFGIPQAADGVSLVDGLGSLLAFLVGFQGTYWVTNYDDREDPAEGDGGP